MTHHLLIADDQGEFYGIAGHHPARTLLRVTMSEIGLTVRDCLEGYEGEEHPYLAWKADVTQGWWQLSSRDDESTWQEQDLEDAADLGADWYWPHEWDDMYLVCEEGEPRAMPATFWRP